MSKASIETDLQDYGLTYSDFSSKPQTNADRIRSMSDEELAEFLECVETAGYNDSSITPRMKNGFPMDMLEWLKSEAKE